MRYHACRLDSRLQQYIEGSCVGGSVIVERAVDGLFVGSSSGE